MKYRSLDIGVIGGGLLGSAFAYGFSQRGLNVGLIDEGDNAVRTARGNFGLVWVQGKGKGMRTPAAPMRVHEAPPAVGGSGGRRRASPRAPSSVVL